MAFNMYPRSDFHELNLDWVLSQVKRAIAAADSIDQLKLWMEQYFDNVEVKDAVREILTEWEQDGTLARLLNTVPLEDACLGWVGFNKGWNVAKNGPIINLAKSYSLKVSSWNQTGSFWFSNTFEAPLDMPLEKGVLVGGASHTPLFLSSMNYTGTKAKFIVCSDIDKGSGFSTTARLQISGSRKKPPYLPGQGVTSDSVKIFQAADSYYQAAIRGRSFAYGNNFTYGSTNDVNDSQGAALMECDTLVLMALLGIPYEQSPYTTTTPDYQYRLEDLRTGSVPWASRADTLIHQQGGRWVNGYDARATTAGALAWMFWDNGYVYQDPAQIQTGDVIFFRRAGSRNFDNVGHVGILSKREDGTVMVTHVSTAEYTRGTIVDQVPLEEYYQMVNGRYLPEDAYFGRINTHA